MQESDDQIFGATGNAIPPRGRKAVMTSGDLMEQLVVVGAPKGRKTTEHDVNDNADCPHIDGHGVRSAVLNTEYQFGGKIARCADSMRHKFAAMGNEL